MEITVTQYELLEGHREVEVSFSLSSLDWCELEKSSEWVALQRLVGSFGKE